MHLFPTFLWRGDVPGAARQQLHDGLMTELAAMGAPLASLKPVKTGSRTRICICARVLSR
jgi:hypothetical protein